MRKTVISIFCFVISFSAFGQENYAKLVDSLRYVWAVPYMENCYDSVLCEIISKGKAIVPDLINKMTDDEVLKEMYIPFFPAEYTVADIAYVAIQEIIPDIPTYKLLGISLDKDCGSCSYWKHLQSKKNRKKFQKNVRIWYEKNKDNLVWVENPDSAMGWVTGDCSQPHPLGGHYFLQKEQ